jgi:hypothetical protein
MFVCVADLNKNVATQSVFSVIFNYMNTAFISHTANYL